MSPHSRLTATVAPSIVRQPKTPPRPTRGSHNESEVLMRRLLPCLSLCLPSMVLLASGDAWAQFGPGGGMRPMGGAGGMGGMGGPGQGAPPSDKPEGPAEEAPDKASPDAATEALPAWPGQKVKT